MNRYLNHAVVDNVGACLSFAGAVHCMAARLLMTVLPLVGLGFILSESAELALVASAVGVAIGSLTWGYRHHRKWRVFLMLGGALFLIFIARFHASAGTEVTYMAIGGLSLAAVHLINRHLCRRYQHCNSSNNAKEITQSKLLTFSLFAILLTHNVDGLSLPRSVSVSGQVVDAESEIPMAQVKVTLVAAGRTIQSQTDESGQFRFDEIVPGTHALRYERVGYEMLNQKIAVNSEPIRIAVKLKPVPFKIGEIVVTHDVEELDRFEKTTDLKLSEQKLNRQMGATIAETLSGEVGIAQRTMGRSTARPVVRGMGGNRLLILEDGGRSGDKSASSADHAVAIDPTTAAKIEITRGPASLIYGSSTLGGVVNVKRGSIPPTLPSQPTMRLTFQGESVNSGLTGTTGVTIPVGNLAWRLELNRRRAGDIHTPNGILENTSLSNTNFSTGGSVVKDWGHIGLSGGRYRSDYGIPGSPEGHINGVTIDLDRQRYEGNLEYAFEESFLEKLKLHSTYARYQHQEFESNNTLGVEFGVLTYNTTALLHLRGDAVAGIWTEYRDHATRGFYWTPHTREMSLAGFFFKQKRYNDFTLQAAVRYDTRRVEPFVEGVEIRAGRVQRRDFGGLSGAVSSIYQWNENLGLGATFMRTFRTPGIEELFSDGPHLAVYSYEIGNAELGAEDGFGTEAFLRYSGNRMKLNLAVFRNQIYGYLSPTQTGEKEWGSGAAGWLWIYQYQGQDAILDGVEFSIDAEIFPRFHAESHMSYVKGSLAASGLPLERIPPLNGRVALRYVPEPLNLYLAARFSDDQQRLGEFEEETDGYLVYDAGVQVMFTMWQLQHELVATLENVFNTEYRQHLSRIKSVMPEPGRNIKFLYRTLF